MPRRSCRATAPFAIHLAFSYDEEVGCFGVRELIADMRDAGVKPLACIIGEPTSMVPAIAHKGVYRYKCCVRGKEAHSSLTPQSVNAIEMAARVVGKLRDMAEGFERNEPRYEGFDVPFSTASVGQFHGGIADNVVPRDAEFRYEFRDLPTADAQAMQEEVVAHARSLEPAMKRVAPDAGFRFETICEIPSFLGSAERQRDPAGPAPVGRAAHDAGGFRHRGRDLQERRHSHGGVRPRQHRAGAPAGRVREPGAAGPLRGLHARPGRTREIGWAGSATCRPATSFPDLALRVDQAQLDQLGSDPVVREVDAEAADVHVVERFEGFPQLARG